MSVTQLHLLSLVKIGSAVIGGVTAIDTGIDPSIHEEPASGEISARIQAILALKAPAGFTTLQVAQALAASGSACSLATSPLALFAVKLQNGGIRAASGHCSWTYGAGLLLPRTLTCGHQGNASLSYQTLAISGDGSTAPVVQSTAATIPAAPAASLWTLSGVTMGGVAVPQIKSVSIDWGLKVDSEGADSDLWDSHAAVMAWHPTITITTSKIGVITALAGQSGVCGITLRNRAAGGTFGSSTLSIAGTGLTFADQPFRASGQKPGEASIRGHCAWDGTNAPIIITAG